jgi:predicted component of type VI protein secretion system
MPISPEVVKRKEELASELILTAQREHRLARSAYLWSQALFVLALCCSVAATICGVFFSVSGKITGGIAALPPLIAFLAINLKLDGRASWHYRKAGALRRLHSRLTFQQPEELSVNHIAAVADARDNLVDEMQAEWDRTLTSNFNEIMKQKSPEERSRT